LINNQLNQTKTINIHFLPDWFITNCENLNSNKRENLYFTFSENPIYLKLDFTKSLKDNIESEKLIESINKNESSHFYNLYVHYLEEEKAIFVSKINKAFTKVIWIIWSEDLYSLPILKFKKYDKYSYKFLGNKKIKTSLKQRIGRLKMIYIDGVDLNNKQKWKSLYQLIKRADVCVTGIEEEAKVIQNKINSTIKFHPFAYISADNDVITNPDNVKEYIQVGNSADPSNNHYEVLLKLANLGIQDKILLPLSYGDKEYTAQLLSDIYNHINPNQVLALQDFMDKQEYYQLLSKVKVAIFPHNIQQAFGNIITLIKIGAKVFLKKRNPLYSQFIRWGIKVYSIEDELTLKEINTVMDIYIEQQNKSIMADIYSEEKVLNYYKSLLSI
jgi:dTDP-N-acetylfucosamine:lipid II N-acetylfucosaminyltransferase